MVPCDIVIVASGEQDWIKPAGSGIQLPLLSHVTLSVTSSQVNIKTKPSTVEIECSLMFLSTNGNSQSRSTARN